MELNLFLLQFIIIYQVNGIKKISVGIKSLTISSENKIRRNRMRIRIMKKKENESFLRKRTRLFFNFTFANLMNPFKFFMRALIIPSIAVLILIADGVFNAKFFDPIFYSLIAPSSMLFRNIFTDQTYFMISIAIGVTITAFVYYKIAQFLFFLLADYLGTLYFKKEVMILDGYDY